MDEFRWVRPAGCLADVSCRAIGTLQQACRERRRRGSDARGLDAPIRVGIGVDMAPGTKRTKPARDPDKARATCLKNYSQVLFNHSRRGRGNELRQYVGIFGIWMRGGLALAGNLHRPALNLHGENVILTHARIASRPNCGASRPLEAGWHERCVSLCIRN